MPVYVGGPNLVRVRYESYCLDIIIRLYPHTLRIKAYDTVCPCLVIGNEVIKTKVG